MRAYVTTAAMADQAVHESLAEPRSTAAKVAAMTPGLGRSLIRPWPRSTARRIGGRCMSPPGMCSAGAAASSRAAASSAAPLDRKR